MTPKYTQIVYGDFETYFDSKYSLSKMPTINYVRDDRFEFMGIALAVDDGPQFYVSSEDEFLEWASGIDWSTTAFCAFNCAFDATVLTQRYGIFPAYYLDPMSMARALLAIPRHNLASVSKHLGLGEKGSALKAGSREVTAELAEYACNDNELSRKIYYFLRRLIAPKEYDLIHWTIRCWAEPTLELDVDVLQRVMDQSIQSRNDLIAASGYSEAQLTSNPQFAQIIRGLGLIPPTKLSETTGEETEAFSKGDDEFVSFMLEYPQHKHIWDGRLAAKSNINIRRPEKFLSIARMGRTTPMPLNYCGAHTGRWSGADGLNVQNLTNLRISDLRLAFRAPPGHKVVVVDSSQIELRINMWFCGQTDVVDLLRNGGDVYRREAAGQFGVAEEQVTKLQRAYGKAVTLGCGYGMGPPKFRKYAAAGPLGMDPIYISEEESHRAISTYRQNTARVPAMWSQLDRTLSSLTKSDINQFFGPLRLRHEHILLPSGRALWYRDLEQGDNNSGWAYDTGKGRAFIWGGTMLENIIQALARDVVAEQLLAIDERYRVVSSTHDEAIYIAREEEAEEALAFGIEMFSQVPEWLEGCPLAAEGGFDDAYSK